MIIEQFTEPYNKNKIKNCYGDITYRTTQLKVNTNRFVVCPIHITKYRHPDFYGKCDFLTC